MATPTEVDAALDSIAEAIKAERQAAKTCTTRFTTAKNNINSLPTVHADVITTINGYNAVTGSETEKLAKDRLSKYSAEFTSLKTKVTTAETDLGAIDFNT